MLHLHAPFGSCTNTNHPQLSVPTNVLDLTEDAFERRSYLQQVLLMTKNGYIVLHLQLKVLILLRFPVLVHTR